MEWLKEYVLTITSISIISMLLECILPNGNIKKYASFGLSLMLSVALIQPILNFETDRITINRENKKFEVDFTQAVCSTVNSIKGYEDAEVYLQQENNKVISVRIKSNKEKVLDKTMRMATADFVKNVLNAIYGVEKNNILISE